jgi:ubiquinone/menaquinone biosynthesis C-methylase UbiE
MPRATTDPAMMPCDQWMVGLASTDPRRADTVLREWVETCPADAARADRRDVFPPGAPAPDFPADWFALGQVQPGAPTNPRIPRLGDLARTRLNVSRDEQIGEHLARRHAGRAVRRVIHLGTGAGTPAVAAAELWPEAEVTRIDRCARSLRFARHWAADRGVERAQCFLQNVQTPVFPDASIDVGQFTDRLHRMPADEERAILAEMSRLIRPSGVLRAMAVLDDDTAEARAARAARGAAGPEPFLAGSMTLDLERPLASVQLRNGAQHAACEDAMALSTDRP